jgi:hypothetical protein
VGNHFFQRLQTIDKWLGPLYRDIDDEPVDEDEDNKIEEEEINAALKRVLILLDQVNDLSKSAKIN